MMGTFCEGMSLADSAGLPQDALLEVLGLGAMVSERCRGCRLVFALEMVKEHCLPASSVVVVASL